jgi:hypothetical protein
VAHACNPSYSGGRDQEARGSKPREVAHETLSRKNPSQSGRMVQGVGPEFKS